MITRTLTIALLLGGMIMFGKTSAADTPNPKRFGLPLNYDHSKFYYVPLHLPEGQGSSLSYSSVGGGGTFMGAEAGYTIGLHRCHCENVLIVDKATLRKKPLFESGARIENFFLLDPKQTKEHPELSKILMIVWRAKEDTPSRFSVANLDGSELKHLTPEGTEVTAVSFDIQHSRALLLLKPKGQKDPNTEVAYVDLKTRTQAAPLAP